MQKTIWVAILLSLSSLGWADINTAQQNLAKNYPNLEINNIASTEMRGIYSAELDGQVVYLNEDAQHLIAGNMLRLDRKSVV